MKTLKLLSALMLLISTGLQAQQAQWELVRENFWGTVAIDPTNSDIIYVSPGGSSPLSGMHKSTDRGRTWQQYTTGYFGGVVRGIIIDPNNPQRLWGFGPHIVRSEDGGVTATLSVNGISVDHHGFQVTAMAYDHLHDILYAGNQANNGGLYRSFDGGQSWEKVNTVVYPEFLAITQDSGWVFSGGAQGLFRSKDFGTTWFQLQPGLLDRKHLFSLAQVPNSRTLYTAGRVGLIYKSFDLGDRWFSISDATTDSAAFEGNVLVSNLDTNYVFVGGRGRFLGYTGGFYLSRNGGKNWEAYHKGLPDRPLSQWSIWALAQTYAGESLYMSEVDIVNVTYKLSQTILTSVHDRHKISKHLHFVLNPPFPNPSNAGTKIEVSIPKIQFVALEIYNVNGERVIILLSGSLGAGTHSLFWNGKNSKGGEVASGIYLLSLRAGEEIITRKMLLIR